MASCDQLGIVNKSSEWRKYREQYLGVKTNLHDSSPTSRENIPDFSQEAFVDALMEFIVADDQVFFNHKALSETHIHLVTQCN
jgi:hypothetical protein